MRLFSVCAGVLIMAGAVDGKLVENSPTYKSLEEVYGAHDLKARVLHRDALRAGRIARSGMASNEEWLAARAPHQCDFPLALHLLIDTSANMVGETEQSVLDSLPAIGKFFDQSHPGSTLSISFFRDKPIEGFGNKEDYCLKTVAVDSKDIDAISAAYEGESSEGGGDWLNNHFGALIQLMKSPITIPWLNDPLKTHVILLISNTAPHFAGDGGEAESQLANFTTFHEDALDIACEKIYYPSPKDVKMALRDANAYLATIVLDSNSKGGWAFKAFDWLNTYLNQPADLVAEQAAPDMIEKQLKRVLEGIERAECGDHTIERREATKIKKTLRSLRADADGPSEEFTECPEPEPARCLECIEEIGCCKTVPIARPKMLIALQHRPKEIFVEASFTTARAESPEAHHPKVVELDSESDDVEIEY